MTKKINNTYNDFIKQSDKGFRQLFNRMPLGQVFLQRNKGSGYDSFFESFKSNVKNKMNSGSVRFKGSSAPQNRSRKNVRTVRRSLMKKAT